MKATNLNSFNFKSKVFKSLGFRIITFGVLGSMGLTYFIRKYGVGGTFSSLGFLIMIVPLYFYDVETPQAKYFMSGGGFLMLIGLFIANY